jgi:hypothetical protein
MFHVLVSFFPPVVALAPGWPIMRAPSPSVGLGEETIPADEARHIDEMLLVLRRIQEERDRRNHRVPRTVHPKQHGCVHAQLQVEPGLPVALRHGIFRSAKAFPALVRFSNSKQRDDRLPDGHGMAIKLLEVDGEKILAEKREAETQDFVLIDHPVFFARNVADLLPLVHDFERLMLGGPIAKARVALKAMISRDHRFRLLRQAGAKRPDNPLQIQYWSTTPFKLGGTAMKFSLRPTADSPALKTGSADKLRRAMAEHLRQGDADFDFLVQVQTESAAMPIEDATVPWNEVASPFRKVATLRIPSQNFESSERIAFGENLSFTPWHSLPDHCPLGGINRARRTVYAAMSARRNQLNQMVKREPTCREARIIMGMP